MSSAQLMDVDAAALTATESGVSQLQDVEMEVGGAAATTESRAKWVDLMPDRRLLDASFEGYKLSLDSFTQYKIELGARQAAGSHGPGLAGSGEYQQRVVVYQHLKLFSLQNLLFVNPFVDSLAYYFDAELRLTRVNYCLPGLLPARQLIATDFQVPGADELRRTRLDRVDPTMRFVSESVAVVCDGYDSLYVIEAARKSLDDVPAASESWTLLAKWQASPESRCLAPVLKDALLFERHLHVLLMNVHEASETGKHVTYVHWLSFEQTAATDSWAFKRSRRLDCQSHVPEYVSLETNGRGVNITGPRSIRFDFDSANGGEIKPTPKPKKKTEPAAAKEPLEPLYTWSQTADEVVVKVRSGAGTKVDKKSVKVSIRPSRLEVRLGEAAVLDSELFAAVKADESTWTLGESSTVELVLAKASVGAWTSLLKVDDQRGEYKPADEPNPAFTSDAPLKSAENKPLFSLEQQLEECDGLTDDQIMGNTDEEKLVMIRRLDGETYATTHQSYINDNKFLFEVRPSAHKSPAFCLRHDVDGILWQPHRVSAPAPEETVWLTHEHTFKAFGYVQASKQEAKFHQSSPNLTLACICDTQKHIYVYRQATDISEANLRNRKTGQSVKHVAKQYLISLDSDKEVLGFYCANEHILALTAEAVYIYKA